MASQQRTPLKDKPLRQAGQSISEELESMWDKKIVPWYLAAAALFSVAINEWVHHLWAIPPMPWIMTIAAVVPMSVIAWRIKRLLPHARNLKLGLAGERVVGQYLERLHAEGYQVFHDVQGPDFNLDHVLIGPAGVFTVETKTWNKPFASAKISFDGERVLVGGKAPERDPVVQALAQSAWLQRELRTSSGKAFDVRPVIVFPGWFVESAAGAHRRLWVLAPAALPTFLQNETAKLPADERKLLCYHLSRMIRAGEQAR